MYSHQEKTSTFEPFGSESISNSLRVNFVRKVFGITAIQLAFTSLLTYLTISNPGFSRLQEQNPGLLLLSGITVFVVSIALFISDNLSKKVPLNYILLSVFTLAESYLVSFIASTYDKEVVLSAMFLTAAVVSALALYALRSKTEINMIGGLIVLLSLASLVIVILSWIFRFKFMTSLSFGVTAIVSGLYLIYDIKVIMGKENIKMSLDDYIRGALMLYVDIIRIFIKILQLLGEKNEKKDEKKK